MSLDLRQTHIHPDQDPGQCRCRRRRYPQGHTSLGVPGGLQGLRVAEATDPSMHLAMASQLPVLAISVGGLPSDVQVGCAYH